MATAAKIHTTADAKTRSIELAREHGHTSCSHAARKRGLTLSETTDELVFLEVEIESAHSDARDFLIYQARTDDARCECLAAQNGRGCWHRGVAILCGRVVAKIYSAAGRAEAERDYHRDVACEGNAAALAPSL